MTSSGTNLSYSKFFPSNVVAFTSERPTDFAFPPGGNGLSDAQKQFLRNDMSVSQAVCNIKQVHGKAVVTARRGSTAAIAEADAIVSNEFDLPIAIRTADCLPVFLYDPQEHVIGLVHAGWRGTKEGALVNTINYMRENFFSKTGVIKAAFGPAIRSCHYEVGGEFHDSFKRNLVPRNGKLYFDMIQENKDQLLEAGVLDKNIFDSGRCTVCDQKYFSHRREGVKAGRMLSLMMIKSED